VDGLYTLPMREANVAISCANKRRKIRMFRVKLGCHLEAVELGERKILRYREILCSPRTPRHRI